MKQFDHERLNVYYSSIAICEWTSTLLEAISKSIAVHKQLDRASTSISHKITEGYGNFTQPYRCRFFAIARGSALECAAAFDVLVVKKVIENSMGDECKLMLLEIVSMLVGLIRSNPGTRVHRDVPKSVIDFAGCKSSTSSDAGISRCIEQRF